MECAHVTPLVSAGAKDSWSREARRVTMLAAELGVAMDDETLLLSDVYDLRAMGSRLQHALCGKARRGERGHGHAAPRPAGRRVETRTPSQRMPAWPWRHDGA